MHLRVLVDTAGDDGSFAIRMHLNVIHVNIVNHICDHSWVTKPCQSTPFPNMSGPWRVLYPSALMAKAYSAFTNSSRHYSKSQPKERPPYLKSIYRHLKECEHATHVHSWSAIKAYSWAPIGKTCSQHVPSSPHSKRYDSFRGAYRLTTLEDESWLTDICHGRPGL